MIQYREPYRDNTVGKMDIFSLFVSMAKQIGVIKIKGSIEGICFYESGGKHYARTKSSLSGKRVKTSPAFRNTMKYARLLAKASQIGSVVYRSLPKEKRNRKLYQQLTGMGMQLIKKGMAKDEIIVALRKEATQLS